MLPYTLEGGYQRGELLRLSPAGMGHLADKLGSFGAQRPVEPPLDGDEQGRGKSFTSLDKPVLTNHKGAGVQR